MAGRPVGRRGHHPARRGPRLRGFDPSPAQHPALAVVEHRRLARRQSRRDGDPLLLATDLADFLVKRGIPFREAHHAVGALVAESGEAKVVERLADAKRIISEETERWLADNVKANASGLIIARPAGGMT